MGRLRDTVLTLICLVILVPLLVLSTAAMGLRPRHWSGIPLSGVDLPMFVRPLPGDSPPLEMDAVTDQLTRMADEGWQAVLPAPDGRLNIEVTRLSPTLFPALGNHFDGDKVGVVYGPLVPQISTGVIPPEPMWQRTDPPGTWLTLMVGFPVPLGAALLLTAVVWADIIGRRRITRARTMSAR